MTTPENKVKLKLRALFKSLDVYYVTVTTSGFGASGHPDFLLCIGGVFIGVECKATPQQKPTVLQFARLNHIVRAGGEAWVVDNTNIHTFAEHIRHLVELAALSEGTKGVQR